MCKDKVRINVPEELLKSSGSRGDALRSMTNGQLALFLMATRCAFFAELNDEPPRFPRTLEEWQKWMDEPQPPRVFITTLSDARDAAREKYIQSSFDAEL